jgi:flagellar basal-body rod protein FlgB
MSSLDGTQAILEAAMRGAWQRQTVLTENIANAETPGYERREVDFQSALNAAAANEESPEQVNFQTETQPTVASPNGNGVSIDQESASLSENGLTYEALTQMLSAHNETLRAAMGIG